jgi:hypothetical protein
MPPGRVSVPASMPFTAFWVSLPPATSRMADSMRLTTSHRNRWPLTSMVMNSPLFSISMESIVRVVFSLPVSFFENNLKSCSPTNGFAAFLSFSTGGVPFSGRKYL